MGLALLFSATSSHGANTVNSDDDYFYQVDQQTEYIFTKEHQVEAQKTANFWQAMQKIYAQEFAWNLDEKTSLILASKKNQIANAWATIYPNNISLFYPGGPYELEDFASSSWYQMLVTHEGSHLYQLNTKTGPSTFTKNVFGNYPFPMFPLFWFTIPNIAVPTWLLEGNSVWNESRFGIGGRLFSGEYWAKVCSLAQANRLREKYLTNDHLFYPYGEEKYIAGGFFFLFLNESYGTEKLNSFFLQHSSHFINPMRTNLAFQEHFGSNYSDLIVRFESSMKTKCQNFQALKAQALLNGPFMSRLSADHDEIFFLTGDGKSPNRLVRYNKQQQQLQVEERDLPWGQIFKLKGNYLSASARYQDRATKIQNSLWFDDSNREENFDGKVVQDIQDNSYLYFDEQKSQDLPALIQDNKLLAFPHSKAILSNDKIALYFLQKGAERILYEGDKKLFSFQGYYGKVLDQGPTGDILFLAATPQGSGVYIFAKGKIQQVLTYDNILDAKFINEQELLVVAVSSEGLSLHKQRLSPRSQLPALLNSHIETQKITLTPPAELSTNPAPYNAIRNMRFNFWSLYFYWGEYTSAQGDISFSDPLAQNQLGGNYAVNAPQEQEREYSLYYINSKHPTNWGFGAKRNESPEDIIEHKYYLYSNLLLWQKGNQSFRASVVPAYEKNDYYEKTSGVLRLQYQTQRNYKLSFAPYRLGQFSLEGKIDNHDYYSYKFHPSFIFDLSSEHFIQLEGEYFYSHGHQIDIGESLSPMVSDYLIRPLRLYADNYYSGGYGKFKYFPVINWSHYFTWFPFSLRRFSPSIHATYFFWDRQKRDNLVEYGFGLMGEVLFAHKLPFFIELEFAQQDQREEKKEVLLKLRQNF